MKASDEPGAALLTVLKGLREADRNEFLRELIKDRRLREDLIDAAVIQSRRNEASRPFSEFVASERRRRARG